MQLLHGDCLELMKDIPDKSIDLILCDLPYGMTQNTWDNQIDIDLLFTEYWRIIKPNGVIALTAAQPFSSLLVVNQINRFKHEWIWVKNRGSNVANTVREPMKEHEHVLIFSMGKWTYNKQMQERVESGAARAKYEVSFDIKSQNYNNFSGLGKKKLKELRVPSSVQKFNCEFGYHPTQKPVALLEYLIKTYTNKGDLVLDNCMGSGSTGVACVNTNRDFIGIELDEHYYNIACERIKSAQMSKPVELW